MEFFNTLRIIRTHLWLVVLTTFVAAGSAAVIDRLHHAQTTYIATAQLIISPNMINRGLLGTVGQGTQLDLNLIAGTYDSYFRNPDGAAVKQVIQQLNLPLSPKALAGSISTYLVPNSYIFDVSVASPDPHLASQAVYQLARNFVRLDQVQSQTAVVSPVSDPLTQFYYTRVAQLQKQLLAVLRDPALKRNPTAQYQQVVKLNGDLNDVYNQINKINPGPSAGAANSVPAVSLVDFTAPQAAVLTRSAFVQHMVLFAALGGLILGLGLALVREYLDTSLRTLEEVREVLGLPILAAIGLFRAPWRRPRRLLPAVGPFKDLALLDTPDATDTLITLTNPFHAGSEAFRNLRTGVLFADGGDKVRTLVITSTLPKEGKSTVAANLAVVMAQAGARVILVDANLRRPVQHALFGTPNSAGLSTLYLDGGDPSAAVAAALQPTPVAKLRLLPAGPAAPSPAELLASSRTPAVLDALKAQADIVIFDTPAMGLLTDAVVLASRADATALVVRAHATRRDLAETALAKLGAVNARVLGAIVNMADQAGSGTLRHYSFRRRGGQESAPPSRVAAIFKRQGTPSHAPAVTVERTKGV